MLTLSNIANEKAEYSMKQITVVSSCFNEVENLEQLWERIKAVFAKHPEYGFELIIADNYSTDGSRDLLRKMAATQMLPPFLYREAIPNRPGITPHGIGCSFV